MESIKEFAARYSVNAKRDGCADDSIPGRQYAKDMPAREEYRCHIYDHGDGKRFGVCLMFMPTSPSGKSAKWTNTRKKLIAAGFEARQFGDSEGPLLFDPQNEKQARLALEVCRVRARRKLSAGSLLVMTDRLRALASSRAAQQHTLTGLQPTNVAA